MRNARVFCELFGRKQGRGLDEPIIVRSSVSLLPGSNVAFSRRRACGRLGTCLRFFPLNGSPLASVTVGYNAWLDDDFERSHALARLLCSLLLSVIARPQAIDAAIQRCLSGRWGRASSGVPRRRQEGNQTCTSAMLPARLPNM